MPASDRDLFVAQVTEHVHVLVDARRHTEPVWVWVGRNRKLRAYTTDQPSLLDQLRAVADEPTVEDPTGAARPVPGSRAPGGQDALDRLIAIEHAVTWWTADHLHRDLRPTVEDNLRLLAGASTRMEDPDLRRLAGDVKRWHGWAATLTGWQTPPWRPRAACPLCARLGTLIVHLDEKRAYCSGCAEVWSEEDGSIGLLADHIRQASDTPQEATA